MPKYTVRTLWQIDIIRTYEIDTDHMDQGQVENYVHQVLDAEKPLPVATECKTKPMYIETVDSEEVR